MYETRENMKNKEMLHNEDTLLQCVANEVERHNNLPDLILEEFYDFINKPWGILRKIEIRKTSDEKIEYLLEELTRRTLSELVLVYNKQKQSEITLTKINEPTNKIEVIGDNKELNEMVLNKVIKGI